MFMSKLGTLVPYRCRAFFFYLGTSYVVFNVCFGRMYIQFAFTFSFFLFQQQEERLKLFKAEREKARSREILLRERSRLSRSDRDDYSR